MKCSQVVDYRTGAKGASVGLRNTAGRHDVLPLRRERAHAFLRMYPAGPRASAAGAAGWAAAAGGESILLP